MIAPSATGMRGHVANSRHGGVHVKGLMRVRRCEDKGTRFSRSALRSDAPAYTHSTVIHGCMEEKSLPDAK